MTDSNRPWLALSGALFFALGLIGALLAPAAPEFAAAPEEVAAFYEREGTALLAPHVLYMLAGAALLAFGGFVRSIAATRQGAGSLGDIAFAGAVAGGAIGIGGASLNVAAALRVEDRGMIDQAVATVSFDASSVLYGAAMPMALAVFVLAVAALCFRAALLPGWVGAVSILLGVALLAVPIAYVSIIVFNFWALLVSLTLFVGSSAGSDSVVRRPAAA